MPVQCPNCELSGRSSTYFVRFGFFYRTSDSRHIQRFRCMGCKVTCSLATFHPCYRQKKRLHNQVIRKLLTGTNSQRRAAFSLTLNRKTVVRKFLFLGIGAEEKLREQNLSCKKAIEIEFDDLETLEHSKCKPLSVTLAVESGTRRILGLKVSSMPAKGRLAKLARKKYGWRRDGRKKARAELFREIKDLIEPNALIKSDSNPHYPPDVARFFPEATHKCFVGKRGSIGGQGELKKVRFDPLFSLNHTCAKLRADINRLLRKTWCTTKRADRLYTHLLIYAHFHNENFAKKQA